MARREPGAASAAFNSALWQMAKRGRRPPCSLPEIYHYWISDDQAPRAVAVRGCQRCPLLELCDAAASKPREVHHSAANTERFSGLVR